MNLTLEQAMAKATKGPLIVMDGEEQTERDVAHIPHSGIILKTIAEKPSLQDQINAGPVNAALFAHWYNRGPELAEALQSALDAEAKAYEWHGHLCLMDGVREKIKEILSRANTVTIPD